MAVPLATATLSSLHKLALVFDENSNSWKGAFKGAESSQNLCELAIVETIPLSKDKIPEPTGSLEILKREKGCY